MPSIRSADVATGRRCAGSWSAGAVLWRKVLISGQWSRPSRPPFPRRSGMFKSHEKVSRSISRFGLAGSLAPNVKRLWAPGRRDLQVRDLSVPGLSGRSHGQEFGGCKWPISAATLPARLAKVRPASPPAPAKSHRERHLAQDLAEPAVAGQVMMARRQHILVLTLVDTRRTAAAFKSNSRTIHFQHHDAATIATEY